jgi:hypothetical protein
MLPPTKDGDGDGDDKAKKQRSPFEKDYQYSSERTHHQSKTSLDIFLAYISAECGIRYQSMTDKPNKKEVKEGGEERRYC